MNDLGANLINSPCTVYEMCCLLVVTELFLRVWEREMLINMKYNSECVFWALSLLREYWLLVNFSNYPHFCILKYPNLALACFFSLNVFCKLKSTDWYTNAVCLLPLSLRDSQFTSIRLVLKPSSPCCSSTIFSKNIHNVVLHYFPLKVQSVILEKNC